MVSGLGRQQRWAVSAAVADQAAELLAPLGHVVVGRERTTTHLFTDTPDNRLAGWGISVAISATVPPQQPNLAAVQPILRGDPVTVRMTVRTHSLRMRLFGVEGGNPVTVSVKTIDAMPAASGGGHPSKRLWRIVVKTKDNEPLATAVGRKLIAQGAEHAGDEPWWSLLPSSSSMKCELPDAPEVTASTSAGVALTAYLRDNVREAVLALTDVGADRDGAIHRSRVALRRIRSAIRSFSPLFDPTTQLLSPRISLLAGELSQGRDLEVAAELLQRSCGNLGPDADVAWAALDVWIIAGARSGRDAAIRAVTSPTDPTLIADLIELAIEPALLPPSELTSDAVLIPFVSSAIQRTRRVIKGLGVDDHPSQWHRARIRAKRARYAADVAAPALGKRADPLAASLAELTDQLGRLQDCAVASDLLRTRLTQSPPLDTAQAFALGRLDGQLAMTAQRLRHETPQVSKRVRAALKAANLAATAHDSA